MLRFLKNGSYLELNVERLQQFMPQLLSRMYIETLIYGNVTKDRAIQLADIVTNTLTTRANTKALLPSQHRRYREVQLPDGMMKFLHSNDFFGICNKF